MDRGGGRSGQISLNLQDLGLVQDYQPKSVNLWRRWNQLSRLQRSTIYLVLSFVLVYIVYLRHQTPPMASRAKVIAPAGGGVAREWPPKFGGQPPRLPDINGAVTEKANINGAVDNEEHNAAAEEGQDNRQQAAAGAIHDVDFDGGDSNNAVESKVEEAAAPAGVKMNEEESQAGLSQDRADHDSNDEEDPPAVKAVDSKKALPPADGSLVFGGPQNDRQRAVVDAFKHAWQGYRTNAWGKDHLKPITKTYQTWFDLGLTLVDGLDTMLMMNLREEFAEARDWVANQMRLDVNRDVNLFETTIRVLGGLLSTYHLSKDKIFLTKAEDLGNRLMGSFDTQSGIPFSDVNLKTRQGHAPKWSPDSSTSEVTTIQLEFRDLSRCTGNPMYEEAASRVSEHVHALEKDSGLVPIFINANSGQFRAYSAVTLRARGDSYYEYLLKQWLQTGKSIDYLRDDYNTSMWGVETKLVRRTSPNQLLFIGEILSGGKDFKPKMDELVCFLPGLLVLGVQHGMPASHMDLAQELAYTCYLTFARQPTFLAPEITYYNTAPNSQQDFFVKPNDAHYLLRPETIESLWYLYYFTGNKTYQDWGWNIFQGIEKYTKVSGGYTTISNVRNPLDTRPKDMMESYFLGETLKYLYLLFADRHEIDLAQWVFNTEGHPLPLYPS